MISDWSGVATEYAYSFEKPVLFIDLPRKVNNPGYENLGIEPSEVSVRTEIGEIIGVKDLSRISEVISRLVSQGSNQIAQIRRSRAKRVFNIDTSAEVGVTYIENIADMGGYKERAEYQQSGR
jgi:YidC/Oxa1 family membrane protein insertase